MWVLLDSIKHLRYVSLNLGRPSFEVIKAGCLKAIEIEFNFKDKRGNKRDLLWDECEWSLDLQGQDYY